MRPTRLIAERIDGPSIHLKDVSLKEGQVLLLDKVQCDFNSGGWHAVLGPNGGGKSTLLKTILGLTKHKGELEIHWPQKSSASLAKLGTIGYLPQMSTFDSSLPISVRDYLLMNLSKKPLWLRRKLPDYAQQALTRVMLDTKLERRVGDLSGGERQRLMLCTALLKQPGLLILDEPMTGLDQQGKDDCLALLSQFHKAGGTLIMVEHDWGVVEEHCDSVYWLDKTVQSVSSVDTFFSQNSSARSFNHVTRQLGY